MPYIKASGFYIEAKKISQSQLAGLKEFMRFNNIVTLGRSTFGDNDGNCHFNGFFVPESAAKIELWFKQNGINLSRIGD